MPGFAPHRRISTSVVVVLFGLIAGKLLSFAWRSLLSHEMPPAGFSDFITFFICINVASQVAFTPMNEMIAKEDVTRFDFRSTMRHQLLLYGVACGVALLFGCGLMMYLASMYGREELKDLLEWVALLLPICGALMLVVAILRSVGDHVSRSVFYLVGVHLCFVVLLLFNTDRALPHTVALFIASYSVACVGSILYFLWKFPFSKGRTDTQYAAGGRQQVYFLASMLLVQALDAVSGWIDSVVLGAVMYDRMGAYSNIAFLAKAVLMASSALYFVIVPVFAALLRGNDDYALHAEYRLRSHHLAFLVTPPALFCALYADKLLHVLFSIGDSSMVQALRVLVIGYWLTALLGPILALHLAKGQTTDILFSTLMFAVVNIGLSVGLVSSYGPTGVALAAGTSYFLSTLYLVLRSKACQRLLSWRVFSYALAVACLGAIVAWLLSHVAKEGATTLILGGASIVVAAVLGYISLLANSAEKEALWRLCRGSH